MARYVLPVVGAVVGFIYGGPAGASLGWSLGAAVGGLVDPQVIKGPGIGDLAQQTSQEGVPRPIVFGLSQPISGNVIVSGQPRVVKKKKSGKGGPKVETESVYRTYAIRICEGPIGGVLRVWKNNKLVYDVSSNSAVSAADNAWFLRTARFFLGSFEQNPSPDLEAILGVGTTPAHRGTAYLVMASDDVTDLRGAIPQFQFQVHSGSSISFHYSDNFLYKVENGQGLSDHLEYATVGYDDSGWSTGQGVFGSPPDAGTPISPQIGRAIWVRKHFDVSAYDGGDIECVCGHDDSGALWFNGTSIPGVGLTNSEDTVTIPANLVVDGDNVLAYRVIDGVPGGSAVNISSYISGESENLLPSTLPELVAAICELVGMDDTMYDVSQLEGTVHGLTIVNTYPAYTILQSLSQMFFFVPSSYDGVLHFVPGGGDSVATITEDDMVDDSDQDIEQAERSDSISVPRVMHLVYYDRDGGLATDKQTSERAGDRRAIGEQTVQSAVVMDSVQAARAIAVSHKVSIEELRGTLRFCLPDSWLELVPSDPVIVQWQGQSRRARITKMDVLDGYQQYDLNHDRQSAYVSEVEGIPAAPQTPPPSSVVGPTLIEPLDIHILRDADDNAGLIMYVAISGTLPAWTGALVELSRNGGLDYTESLSSGTDSVMGVLESELPDHPQAYPDQTNSVVVEISTPYAELEETDLRGLLNRQNLAIVGDELIQFGSADETSEGHWELSYLIRGRRGTLPRRHEVGERFVLLDVNAVGTMPMSVSDIGSTFTFRATSFGETEDTATVVSVVYQGVSQQERRVGYLRGRLSGSTAVVDWQGVGRLGAGATATQALRFTGYHVTFTGSAPGELIEVDTTATHLEQDVSSLTLPVRVAVSQVNSLTDEGPETEIYLGA